MADARDCLVGGQHLLFCLLNKTDVVDLFWLAMTDHCFQGQRLKVLDGRY